MIMKPVKRITASAKDHNCLSVASDLQASAENEQPVHYRDRVVIKPWGYEFLIFKNDFVAVWFLFIKRDHSTSMHCHPLKKTSLTLLSGKALCNTFQHRNFLSAGHSLIIDPAVFHSTKALSLDGITLLEVETPPAKLDLCRLEDKYGRQAKGYESQAETVTDNLDDFGYFYFDATRAGHQHFSVLGRYSISLERYPSGFDTEFPDPGSIYCVCQGGCIGPNQQTIVSVGETERGGYLRGIPQLLLEHNTILLKVNVFN